MINTGSHLHTQKGKKKTTTYEKCVLGINPVSTGSVCFSTHPKKMKFSKADFTTVSKVILKFDSSRK